MTTTTLDDPNEGWWRAVMSEDQYNQMTKRLEHVETEESTDTIEFTISVDRETFNEQLAKLGDEHYGMGSDIIDAVVAAMALEYMANDLLEPDMACTVLYSQIFNTAQDDEENPDGED